MVKLPWHFVFQGLVFIIFRRQVNDPQGYYGRLLNVYLAGLVPALASVIASVHASGVMRLVLYFSPAAILLWPMIFMSLRAGYNKYIISAIFFSVAIAYFVMTTLSFHDLVPYEVNVEPFL